MNFCFCRRILENYWQPLLKVLGNYELFKVWIILNEWADEKLIEWRYRRQFIFPGAEAVIRLICFGFGVISSWLRTRTGSCSIKAVSILLNPKYPKELNDSSIAISLRYDYMRLSKICFTNFSLEITCFGWVKWNCSVSVITYSFHLPTHSSTWISRFTFNEKRNQPLHQLWSRTVPNSQTARKLRRSFFSRSASSHFIHRVPSKSHKLNLVHGHHCRDNDCLFKVNLPFWLSPETMFPKILHIWILSFSKKYCKTK